MLQTGLGGGSTRRVGKCMVANIGGDDVLKVAHLQNVVTPQCSAFVFGTL